MNLNLNIIKSTFRSYKKVFLITGGIASGKTFISNIFQKFGCYLINSDQIVKGILENDLKLQKSNLIKLIQQDISVLDELEDLIHPKVFKTIQEDINNFSRNSNRCIAVEIPLLFESRHKVNFDNSLTIAVLSDTKLKQKRFLQRENSSSLEKYDMFSNRHFNDNIKANYANYSIHNQGTKMQLYKQIMDIIANLKFNS